MKNLSSHPNFFFVPQQRHLFDITLQTKCNQRFHTLRFSTMNKNIYLHKEASCTAFWVMRGSYFTWLSSPRWWSGGEGRVHTSGSPQLCFLQKKKKKKNRLTFGLISTHNVRQDKSEPVDEFGTNLLCLTAATRSGPENMENRLSPLAEDVSSLELAESPWLADQLLFTASLRTQPVEV